MLGAIVKVLGEGVGQYFGYRKQKAAAKAELEISELRAKTGVSDQRAALELETLKQTSSLDTLAVRQANKSWFDEFLSLLLLSPGLLSAIGACLGASPENWGRLIFDVMNDFPLWYQAAIGLIMVHYFGFRSLLRLYLNGNLRKPQFTPTYRKRHEHSDNSD